MEIMRLHARIDPSFFGSGASTAARWIHVHGSNNDVIPRSTIKLAECRCQVEIQRRENLRRSPKSGPKTGVTGAVNEAEIGPARESGNGGLFTRVFCV
jgi:hypothetical protein